MDMNKAIIVEEYLDYLKRVGQKPSRIHLVKTTLNCFIREGHDFENYENYITFLEDHTVKKRSYYYYDVVLKFVKFAFSEEKEIKKLLVNAITMFGRKDKDPKPRNSIISERDQMRIINAFDVPTDKKYNSKQYLRNEKLVIRHQLIAWIQKVTGVRAGDVIRTKKKQIRKGIYKDDNGKTFIVTDITFLKKGDKVQKIPIFDEMLIERLQEYLLWVDDNDDEFVFADRDCVTKHNRDNDNAVLTRNYYLYYQALRHACKKCGFDISQFATHDWRRNFANKVWVKVLKKSDIVALQRVLGHAHVQTTINYLRQSGLESRDVYKHTFDVNT